MQETHNQELSWDTKEKIDKTIKVSLNTHEFLRENRKYGETFNETLQRLLGIEKPETGR